MSTFLSRTSPLVLAHRGGALEAPENSRTAIEHTLALGLTYLETDVRATADGVAILMHDPTVDRTTDGHGRVSDLTWAEVAQLRDGSGARPVRLTELLADYPSLRLNLDAKDDRVVAPLVRAVIEARAQDRVCLAAFSDTRLRVLRAAFGPEVASSLGRREAGRLLAAARLPARTRHRVVRDLAAVAVCVQVPPVFRGVPVVTRRLVATAHATGLAVHVWTINEPAEMNRLLDLGVDGLITDRPSTLQDLLQARA